MTTELTKAAQQALEALKLCYDVVEYPANGTSRQDKAIAALERALTQRPAAQTEREAPAADPRIRIDFKQATELLEMFSGLPAEIVLQTGDGHSGRGLYAWWDADPSAGAMYLGQTDEEAEPEARASLPASQQATPAQEVAAYFSYGEDAGYLEHATAEAAREQAKADIRGYRNDAMHDNEWPSEVDSVCWGVVLQKATAVDNSDEAGQESFEYELGPAPQQATPEPVAFSHAGHFYNLVSHALMDVKRPDACGHRLRLILDELATLMGQPATPEPVGSGGSLCVKPPSTWGKETTFERVAGQNSVTP